MPQLPSPAGFNQSTIDNRSNKQSGQTNYCTASRRLNRHHGWASQWARLCVCAAIMRALSSPLVTPGQRSTSKTSFPTYTMDLHSQARRGQRGGGEERSLRLQTPYHCISPSFPLICLSRAGYADSAHILLQLQDPLSASLLSNKPTQPISPCSKTPRCILCVNWCQSTLGTDYIANLVEKTPPCLLAL